MPPRKVLVKRKPKATTPSVAGRQLPAPEAKLEPKLAEDLKVKEPAREIPVQEKVSDANRTVSDVSEARKEGGQTVCGDGVVKEDLRVGNEAGDEGIHEKEDLLESENVDGVKEGEEVEEDEDGGVLTVDGSQLEKNAEMNSAQEEMTAPQVDDPETHNDNNNGDIEGTTETVSIQESVKYDFLENMDSDETDGSEGDDAEGDEDEDEDEDPALIVQDSSPDSKKEKGTELYIGKLDKSTVEDDLVSVFKQFGELKSARIVRKPNSNKSKGFGFVRFASVDQAKRALSELKDGVEVKGKRIVISPSEDNDTLFLGNISKTWTKEQVLQQLKEHGIEHIDMIRLEEDPRVKNKNKAFAFLEFSTHSDAVAAFQRLKKPDVFFGCDLSAKVAFAETTGDEDLSPANRVYLEGFPKDWNEEKAKDLCEKYGEILKIDLYISKQPRRKDFGFVSFNSSDSALACIEGINNTATEGEAKIKASMAKPQQKVQIPKQGIRGGYKVEKQSENPNKNTQAKSSKTKGVLNTQQTKTKPKKNKQKGLPKKDSEGAKEAESSKVNGDRGNLQQAKRKRNSSFGQKQNAQFPGAPKKPKNGSQVEASQPVSKAGNRKRKKNEVHEDRGNRNTQGRQPFKKQKGNLRGRERDNFRKPKSDTRPRRGHDDYRGSTNLYAPTYVASAPGAYHVASDHSRHYSEMAPHAGYIEPASANQSRPYSGYVRSVARTPPSQHQAVYIEPVSTGQSHHYTRYVERPVVTTQSHRGYIHTAGAREVQPYREYRSSAVARDPYDSRLSRRSGVASYGGPPPQAPEYTSYYQGGGSYSGGYGSRGAYY